MTNRNPGCQSGIVPMEVTEGEYSDDPPVAIYRTTFTEGFKAKKVDSDLETYGEDLTVYPRMMTGVYYTGKRFFATRIGSKWHAASTGDTYWSAAVTQGDICDSGEVELFEDGPTVTAETDSGLLESTAVEVAFDDERQKFVIVAARCPTLYSGAPE